MPEESNIASDQEERRSGQDRRSGKNRRNPLRMINRLDDDVLRRVSGVRRSEDRRQDDRRQS